MSLSVDEFRRRVVEVLAEEFELDPEDMVPEATLYEDLGLDSLDAVDMVVVLQKTFDVKLLDDDALRSIRTMEDLHIFPLRMKQEQDGA